MRSRRVVCAFAARLLTFRHESSPLYPYAGRGYYAILAQTLIFMA